MFLIDITSPSPQWASLGDAFHTKPPMFATHDATPLPPGALFRRTAPRASSSSKTGAHVFERVILLRQCEPEDQSVPTRSGNCPAMTKRERLSRISVKTNNFASVIANDCNSSGLSTGRSAPGTVCRPHLRRFLLVTPGQAPSFTASGTAPVLSNAATLSIVVLAIWDNASWVKNA
jgi:hypothetical protein